MKVQSSYRLILIVLIVLFTALNLYFMYYFIDRLVNLEEALALNIAGSVVLLLLSIFQVYSLIKGFNNEDVLLREIVYEGENINKSAYIVVSIFLVIGLAGTIAGFICPMYFVSEAPNIYILALIALYVFINALAFVCYPIVEKLKYKKFLDTLNCKK